jgi:hypothetical protein
MALFDPAKKRRTEIISNQSEHVIIVQLVQFFRIVVQILVLFLIGNQRSARGIWAKEPFSSVSRCGLYEKTLLHTCLR